MSWWGLLLLGPIWTAFCGAIARRGWIFGMLVGGSFWLLIVVERIILEWWDGWGWVGAVRRRLEHRRRPPPEPEEEP